jgi:ribosomal protein S28E/S33
MKRTAVALCLFLIGCGGSTPTSPSVTPTPTPTPAPSPAPPPSPTTASLTGTVTVTGSTVRLSNVIVRVLDGPNAGRTATTDTQGAYRFDGLTIANMNLSASQAGWDEARAGVYVDGTNTLNFTIRTTAPWTKVGSGDDIWSKPSWVTRVRVHGSYTGYSSNFIMWCGTQLVVNELLGAGWSSTTYDGTLQLDTRCGADMRSEKSSGVSWSVTEVR